MNPRFEYIDVSIRVRLHRGKSENFYVHYTMGKQATENIKMQFYMLPTYRMNMISAENATYHNLNWAHQLYAEQKNLVYRGINPVGLLYVIASWSGLVADPTTESALEKAKREFVIPTDH